MLCLCLLMVSSASAKSLFILDSFNGVFVYGTVGGDGDVTLATSDGEYAHGYIREGYLTLQDTDGNYIYGTVKNDGSIAIKNGDGTYSYGLIKEWKKKRHEIYPLPHPRHNRAFWRVPVLAVEAR